MQGEARRGYWDAFKSLFAKINVLSTMCEWKTDKEQLELDKC